VQGPVAVLSDETVGAARAAGADDAQIHDTVLVASAFCMINRYVTCLGTDVPASAGYYDRAAQGFLAAGYAATLTRPAVRRGVRPPQARPHGLNPQAQRPSSPGGKAEFTH
jgi:hypothetical protein